MGIFETFTTAITCCTVFALFLEYLDPEHNYWEDLKTLVNPSTTSWETLVVNL